MKLHIRRWGLLLLLLAAALPGYAQGMIIVDRIMPPPGVIIPPHPPRPAPLEPLQLTIQTVDLKVRDFAATVTVEQTFRNQHGGRVEGTFLFPLPAEAAVTDFAMTVNGELVGAELLDADKARTVYEDIVRSQRDPGLLEYIDRTSFRARIFPIEPGETKRIKLEYSQALTADDGLARFVLPLKASAWQQGMWRRPVPMPRPFPLPTERDALRPSIVGPAPEGEPDWTPGRLTITAEIAAEAGIKSVYSPTHELDLQREGDHLVRVSYESSGTPPSSDFLLYYQLADADFGLSLVPYRGASDDVGTFLMLIAPKSEFRETQLQAKDIIFVADVSGSMSGQKIVQMRRALTFCLEQLNPTDRFGVIAFSSDVSAFEDGLVEATDANRAAAIEFVADLEARGGTNIGGALETALADLPTNRDPARPAMVVFLTDGQPTVGETRVARLLEGVEQQNGAEARLFVFGVGDDVNTELLDRLSADNHGTRTYVRPGEDLEVPVSSFYAKIAYPVLSDLKLKVEGVRVEELQPTRLPDLFRGSQLTILGRYHGTGPATVTLSGTGAQGEQSHTYQVDFPARERTTSFVPRLWATRKVGWLLEQIRLNGETAELKDEIVELATRYGILTPYTSFLVLEPGMAESTQAQRALRGPAAAPAMDGLGGMPGGYAGGMGGPAPGRPAAAAPRDTRLDSAAGAAAVDRAQHDQFLQEAEQLGRTNATQQQVGTQTFYLVDDYWTDSTWPTDEAGLDIIHLQWGSAAYFELARLRPDLAPILAVGEQLKAHLGGLYLQIDDEGQTELTAAQRTLLEE